MSASRACSTAPRTAATGPSRLRHVAEGHPLREVTVVLGRLQLALTDPVANEVHLALARDTCSGRVVAAVAATTTIDAEYILDLFGDPRDDVDVPSRIGIARRCAALPDTLVLGHGLRIGTAHDRWASAHGIALKFQVASGPGETDLPRSILRLLDDACAPIRTGADLIGAIRLQLARHDTVRRHGEGEAPLDRWREGVERYLLRMT